MCNRSLLKKFIRPAIEEVDEEEYEDAFDHIDPLEQEIFNNGDIDELTEEIFPGVRKLKSNK